VKGKRVLIVGGGLAGLTAGAYLARAGFEATVLERNGRSGGLVGSFEREGFTFDAGPRAVGDAGILSAMLRDLGIDLPLLRGAVSTGIEDRIVHHDDPSGIREFCDSLRRLFPGSAAGVSGIERRIRQSCRMARVLTRVPNPAFKNPLSDPRYLFTRFIPWLPSFFAAVLYEYRHRRPVEKVLAGLGVEPALADMVCQHFFKGTPERFVFGYFENFLDYRYPLGGTGRLAEALERKYLELGGALRLETEAERIDVAARRVTDPGGRAYDYDALVWAADLKGLYRRLDWSGMGHRERKRIIRERDRFLAVPPGESVISVFLGVDESPEFFRNVSRGHFIYTPSRQGLGELRKEIPERLKAGFAGLDRDAFFSWLDSFIARNAFEISIPALKDPSLAPPERTGLAVSVLFDGEIARLAEGRGWLEELRERAAEGMIRALDSSVYPGLRDKILFRSVSTPLTIERRFLTEGGAITGWSLETRAPVPSSLPGAFDSVKTGIPGVWKAGQWSFSPSGVPIALLTGRIAASAVDAALSRGASREGRR